MVLEPSPLLAVMRKVVASLVYALLLTQYVPVFPIRIIKGTVLLVNHHKNNVTLTCSSFQAW